MLEKGDCFQGHLPSFSPIIWQTVESYVHKKIFSSKTSDFDKKIKKKLRRKKKKTKIRKARIGTEIGNLRGETLR